MWFGVVLDSDVSWFTIQLYCLCIEKFAFWRVIYIKIIQQLTIKRQQLGENTELKTAQIQGAGLDCGLDWTVMWFVGWCGLVCGLVWTRQ